MIGLLIIAHENLGESLIRCVAHVLGDTPKGLRALGVSCQTDPNALLDQIRAAQKELDDGAGVLMLTDICGATPSNVATMATLAAHGEALLISGLNLPMLLRAINYRHLSLTEVSQRALDGGHAGVMRLPTEDCPCDDRGPDHATA